MTSGRAQVMACPMDWTTFRVQRPDMSTSPFLERLGQISPEPRKPATLRKPPALVIDELTTATGASRRSIVLEFVAEQVASTLDLANQDDIDLDRPLREMGLDSLMAVDLRNKLSAGIGGKLNLPATMVFDHPTVAALADGLLGRLAAMLPEDNEPDSADKGADAPDIENLEDLSEDEIEALFATATGGSA